LDASGAKSLSLSSPEASPSSSLGSSSPEASLASSSEASLSAAASPSLSGASLSPATSSSAAASPSAPGASLSFAPPSPPGASLSGASTAETGGHAARQPTETQRPLKLGFAPPRAPRAAPRLRAPRVPPSPFGASPSGASPSGASLSGLSTAETGSRAARQPTETQRPVKNCASARAARRHAPGPSPKQVRQAAELMLGAGAIEAIRSAQCNRGDGLGRRR
jgi:hypothetical protein